MQWLIWDTVYKYSGIIVVAVAFLSLVFPYFIFRDKYHLETISETVKVPVFGHLISVGIILASIFQIIYADLLMKINLSYLSIGGEF